jgi:GcrA cell cycle regulator
MGNCRIHDWTDARIALLTELWLGGVTGGEIGRQMGVSRSAVMGKLRRLDMLRRDRPRMPVRRVARLLKTEQAIPVPKPVPEKVPHKRHLRQNKRPLPPPEPYKAPPSPPLPAYGTLNLLDLRHNSCRWPEGDGPIFVFCGRPRHHESSYCAEHHAMAHNRGSQRDYDRAAEQALAGKLFASRAGVME